MSCRPTTASSSPPGSAAAGKCCSNGSAVRTASADHPAPAAVSGRRRLSHQPLAPLSHPGIREAIEVDRTINGCGPPSLGGRQHPVGYHLAGRRLTVRIDGSALHLIDGHTLLAHAAHSAAEPVRASAASAAAVRSSSRARRSSSGSATPERPRPSKTPTAAPATSSPTRSSPGSPAPPKRPPGSKPTNPNPPCARENDSPGFFCR